MPTTAFTVFVPAARFFVSFLHRCEDFTYTAAYRGTIDAPGDEVDPSAWVGRLDRIFADGNGEGTGPGFTVNGRSMSVGDVVTIRGVGTWFRDSEEWRLLPPEEAERFAPDAETCPRREVDLEWFDSEYHPAYELNNGLMVHVRRSDMGPEAPLPTEVAVAGECRVTGRFHVLEHVPLHGLAAMIDGTPMENALPGLARADREFIKSAVSPGAMTPDPRR